MIVRFDDSLPILVHVIADELGEAALASGVILRDTTGRLTFFADKELPATTIEQLSTRLRSELGPYARTDRVLAGKDDFGAAEMLKDPSALVISVKAKGIGSANTHSVRLLDRRLVGADWLREPVPAAPPPPRFVFASIKGGVGRSTALCVAAAEFASRGRRVLAVDLDMEAPGIGAMLLDEGTLPEFGLVDALVENGLAPLDETFLADLVGPSALSDRRGKIDVIPAFGRRSIQNPAEVLAKIARAYAEDVRSDGSVSTILDQVRSLVDRFAKPKRYDAILVDSRAGLHETTASSILGLGADVFLFGLDERQTFQGYAALLAHLARFVRPGADLPEWLGRVTMVQGKAPRDADERGAFVEKCRKLFADVGLSVRLPQADTVVPLPAGTFKDVPWDDDDNISDEDLTLDLDEEFREPISILEDDQFRLFEPSRRSDLLSEQVYRSSFGQLLDRMNESFVNDEKGVA